MPTARVAKPPIRDAMARGPLINAMLDGGEHNFKPNETLDIGPKFTAILA